MGIAPTILDLHRLAIARGFPRDETHEILHDMAVAGFGADSLTQLNGPQRRLLADWVRAHDGKPSRPFRRSRRRSGRPKRDGVARMITTPQRELINTLASELGWGKPMLERFLQTHFEVGSMTEITTSPQAGRVIRMLKSYKWSRNRKRHRRDTALAGSQR